MKKSRYTDSQIMAMDASLMARMKELEEENRRLKKITLRNNSRLRSSKKLCKKSGKAVATRGVSIRLACHTFGISETCYRYQPRLHSENEEIANWLIQLTEDESDWGFGLCFDYLRNEKGVFLESQVRLSDLL